MACVRRGWAWRRGLGALARSPRELLLGSFGLACWALGLVLEAGTLATLLVVAGVGLVTLGVLLPLVTEFELNTSGFKFKQALERRDTELEPFLDERQQQRLGNLAGLLTGDLHAGPALVEDALVRAYARWSQVPREHQELFLLCTVVRLAVGRARLQRVPPAPDPRADAPGLDGLVSALAQLTPHERALLLLRHWEVLAPPQISVILERPADVIVAELDAVEAAYDALASTG